MDGSFKTSALRIGNDPLPAEMQPLFDRHASPIER
jgi:hypothetical protein